MYNAVVLDSMHILSIENIAKGVSKNIFKDIVKFAEKFFKPSSVGCIRTPNTEGSEQRLSGAPSLSVGSRMTKGISDA